MSHCDFSVVEGARTVDRQRQLMADGDSWTMDSYHIPRVYEGMVIACAAAVDLYPWVDGHTSHRAEHYAQVARAMFQAL